MISSGTFRYFTGNGHCASDDPFGWARLKIALNNNAIAKRTVQRGLYENFPFCPTLVLMTVEIFGSRPSRYNTYTNVMRHKQ